MIEHAEGEPFSKEEVGLALRNHGMHLEGLRYPITPIGMHYLLIHFDIPAIDGSSFELEVTGRATNPPPTGGRNSPRDGVPSGFGSESVGRALAGHRGQQRFDQQAGLEPGAASLAVREPVALGLSGPGSVEEPQRAEAFALVAHRAADESPALAREPGRVSLGCHLANTILPRGR